MTITWADLTVGSIIRYQHLSSARRRSGQPLVIRRGRVERVLPPPLTRDGQTTITVLNKDGSLNTRLGLIALYGLDLIVSMEAAAGDQGAAATGTPSSGFNAVRGIGYEGQDLAGFLAAITSAGIEVVIDIRLNPISRKQGFSKRALTKSLAGIGVAYRHEPALGNPKTNRAGFSGATEEWSAARSRYEQLLLMPPAQDAMARVAQIALTSPTAVLCFEADQRRCHRDVVLSQLTGLALADALVAGLPVVAQTWARLAES
jgi:hypothetical protein